MNDHQKTDQPRTINKGTINKRRSSLLEREIKRSARHWTSIGPRPMPTIL